MGGGTKAQHFNEKSGKKAERMSLIQTTDCASRRYESHYK
jgi:hypothetical protein